MKSRIPSLVAVGWTMNTITGDEVIPALIPSIQIGDGFQVSNDRVTALRKSIVRVMATIEYINSFGGSYANSTVWLNDVTVLFRIQAYMMYTSGTYGNGGGRIWKMYPGDFINLRAMQTDTQYARTVSGSLSVEEILTN